MPKQSTYQLRVTEDEKQDFIEFCKARKEVPSEVLRGLMADYCGRSLRRQMLPKMR